MRYFLPVRAGKTACWPRVLNARSLLSDKRLTLVDTVKDMSAFSQLDDHIITLIKYSTDVRMARAKQLIHQLECRGESNERIIASSSNAID
jgi:hypothetical protein